jgi:hypothetical protein
MDPLMRKVTIVLGGFAMGMAPGFAISAALGYTEFRSLPDLAVCLALTVICGTSFIGFIYWWSRMMKKAGL